MPNPFCPMCGALAEWDRSTNPNTGNVWEDNDAWCTLRVTCSWDGYVYELWDGE